MLTLRINLKEKSSKYEILSPQEPLLFGRYAISYILNKEISPNIDPLSEENKLIISPGLFADTSIPCGNRLSIGSKSPLTGLIKETNSGGIVAKYISSMGLSSIIIEDIYNSDTISTVIEIKPKEVIFHENIIPEEYGVYDTLDFIKKKWNENVSAICVGPSRINRYKTSSIASTGWDFRPRFAGRGGLGAVMASKNIKAIVFSPGRFNMKYIYDNDELDKLSSRIKHLIENHPLTENFRRYGTAFLLTKINDENALPTENFRRGYFDKIDKISEYKLFELLSKRKNSKISHSCMDNCLIRCSNVYTDEDGNEIVSGLEYETIALFGANCLIEDIDTIAKINRVCNDLCIDTMEIACSVACAMEAGIISWGDGKTVLKILNQETKPDVFKLILNGCYETGTKLNISRIPHVKKQSLAAYDPRVFKGTGVTYATSPMGADHTCGNILPFENQNYIPFSSKGQIELSMETQYKTAVIDTLGLCLFAYHILSSYEDFDNIISECVKHITGNNEFSIQEMGKFIIENEKLFNKKSDMEYKDSLPDFFYNEKIPIVESVFNIQLKGD